MALSIWPISTQHTPPAMRTSVLAMSASSDTHRQKAMVTCSVPVVVVMADSI